MHCKEKTEVVIRSKEEEVIGVEEEPIRHKRTELRDNKMERGQEVRRRKEELLELETVRLGEEEGAEIEENLEVDIEENIEEVEAGEVEVEGEIDVLMNLEEDREDKKARRGKLEVKKIYIYDNRRRRKTRTRRIRGLKDGQGMVGKSLNQRAQE